MSGAPKEALLASGGFVPTGLPQDYWSAVDPPLETEIAEVVLGASHSRREPPDEARVTCRCSAGRGNFCRAQVCFLLLDAGCLLYDGETISRGTSSASEPRENTFVPPLLFVCMALFCDGYPTSAFVVRTGCFFYDGVRRLSRYRSARRRKTQSPSTTAGAFVFCVPRGGGCFNA